MRCFPYVFRRLSPSEMIFKASATSKRKDNSPQARLPWTCRRQLLCEPRLGTKVLTPPHQELFPTYRSRNVGPSSLSPIAREPARAAKVFDALEAHLQGSTPFQGGFPRGLGPTYPCPSTVHMETYSASVFCVNLNKNNQQNNRYYHQDLH